MLNIFNEKSAIWLMKLMKNGWEEGKALKCELNVGKIIKPKVT
jgi:hypothetical protein